MYQPGRIIHFDPFFFDNGSCKPKYFLVLALVDNQVVLASLPSSRHHLPMGAGQAHGCTEQPENGISCYTFLQGVPITTTGWSFPLTTYLYGFWLADFAMDKLLERYPIAGVDYEIVGDLLPNELGQIISCFATSAQVKRKYKRWLTA